MEVRYHVLVLKADPGAVKRALKKLAVLMAAEHLEYIVCRCLDHLIAFSKDNCLKNVYELGDVGHLYTLAVLVEDIEVDACDERVADRVLLIKEARIGAFLNVIPCAPLVNHEADPAVRVISVHDGGMLLDEFFHGECFRERHIPLFVIELSGRTLVIPIVGKRVIVERKAVHVTEVLRVCALLSEAFTEHCLCPVIVLVCRAYSKLLDLLVRIKLLYKSLIVLIEICVVLRDHVAAASPCLVADSEIIYCPGLLAAVGSS